MDLARLRFGDWVMGIGGLAVLVVMFLDWYGIGTGDTGFVLVGDIEQGGIRLTAWEAFAVNDVILALAALMALTAFVLTAVHPTAAVPLAISSLATLVALVALVLVALRLIWPPDIVPGADALDLDAARLTGAWLGLVATTALAGGCLASIRDERLPRPRHQVEPRLVKP